MRFVNHAVPFLSRTVRAGGSATRLPSTLVLSAIVFLQLIRFDILLASGSFSSLRKSVRSYPLGKPTSTPDAVARICSAIDYVVVWYSKQVFCLQRSAATACVLKQFGVPAVLVIGVQRLPFKAHAWIEVHGCVVNDKPYMREMYEVLDEC
jgi:Transglutaminase-like superfamily